ncbi:MAG TPA: UDP-glucose/GDP-mannose dehydrogenase family protein [Armatimonadota bacterium]|nr:UDP-glucose/GDP-mannose dehydrogenase family protein [Armatimonadota bacterium]
MVACSERLVASPVATWEGVCGQMNISVIGTGYVGLVTGAVFADLGNEVICVDTDAEKVSVLNAGRMPIFEPGLEEMVHRNVSDDRIAFTTDLASAVRSSEIIFIAVGTPPGPNGESDLSHVIDVARGIAQHLDRYKVVVNKSTVPIGTGNLLREIIESNKQHDVDFDVVSNPEFLREGSAINDTLYPDRIIIGAPSQTVAMKLLELYAPLERPMLITDITSAEIIKYASNAFLSTKISFINAMATLCEHTGGDVLQVAKGMGYDRRIGEHFLQAGLGFGGSCFAKDLKALIHTCSKLDCDGRLFESALEINNAQPARFVNRLKAVLDGLEGRKIAVLGLAFKPNTDDMRDAKSIDVISRLLDERAIVQAYDPIAMDNCRRIFPQITYCENPYEAAEGASALLVVTEWNEFRFLNFEKIKEAMERAVIFDGRNMYDPQRMRRLGFDYYCIGRAANYARQT